MPIDQMLRQISHSNMPPTLVAFEPETFLFRDRRLHRENPSPNDSLKTKMTSHFPPASMLWPCPCGTVFQFVTHIYINTFPIKNANFV
jgi:hypothetical protein